MRTLRATLSLCSIILGLVFVGLPAAAPGGISSAPVDLYRATSIVSYDGDPRTAAGLATAKVVTPDGRRIPYPTGTTAHIESVLKANQRTTVIGQVDPVTGQPVGAVAINKQPCDFTNAPITGDFELCIGVEYYHTATAERLVKQSVTLNKYSTPTQCEDISNDATYFNVWRNITILHNRFDGYPSTEILRHCVSFFVEQWYGLDSRELIFATNTRFHPTTSLYSDATHGHPIVFLNGIPVLLLTVRFRRQLMRAVEDLRLAA
jgi:hypothetical protein